MQIRVEENSEDFGACGCGRSPNGKCIGWHALSPQEYEDALVTYETQLFDQDPDAAVS
jgi:hypothetical protein